MLRQIFRAASALLCIMSLASCGGETAPAGPIVMAASSMQEALTEAADVWENQGHLRPVLSFAATSSLARQVMSGAPADLFVSADEEWLDALQADGKIDAASRADMAGNTLVLIAPKGSGVVVRLREASPIQRAIGDSLLAMADPDAVPAGRYGKQALERMGLWERNADRISNSENVRAALALVERGEAPIGLVYASDAAASDKVEIAAVFPPEAQPEIRYPVALLAGSSNREAAEFRAFLLGPQMERILSRHGFIPLGETKAD